MGIEQYTSDFSRNFPRGSTIAPKGYGIDISLPCSGGHDAPAHFEKRMPIDRLKALLTSKGWRFHGKLPTCPDCNKKEKPMSVTSIDVPAAPPKAATVDARKAKREVMTWLDQSFNVEKGRYDDGVNDAFIAKETGMSEQAVGTLREEFYGPLREPVEVANFRKRIADVEQAVANIETQASDTFAAIKEQVGKLASELAAIVKRNGW